MRFCSYEAPASSLRILARSSVADLSAACEDKGVRLALLKTTSEKEQIVLPVLVHRVQLEGKNVWVIASVWEIADPTLPMNCCHVIIEILEPITGKVLSYDRCG